MQCVAKWLQAGLQFCVCVLTVVLAVQPEACGQQADVDQSARVVAATESLFGQLSESQRQTVSFRFNDDEQRLRWSNLPSGIFARRGLRMGDLSESQRSAVMGVLKDRKSTRLNSSH